MKRALIILLILGVAGGLFAQDLVWTGGVTTGAFIELGDDYDDPIIYADDDDSGDAVHGWIHAKYDAGDWGLQVGSVASIESGDGAGAVFYDAHGWIKFLSGMLTVRGGLIDPAVWNTGGEIDENVSSGLGIRVEVEPIDGLNIGAFFSYVDGLSGDSAAQTGDKIADFFQETAIGFSYTADFFNVSAALKLFSEASNIDIRDKKTAAGDTDMKLIFALGFPNIAGINILVDGAVYGLGDFSNVGELVVYEEFDFGVTNALKVGILLGEKYAGNSDVGFYYFLAKPWVEFGVNDNVTVGASVPITMEKADSLGFASLGVNLWAKYAIGGAWLKGGYGFMMRTADYGDSLNHYVQIVFGFEF